MEQFDSLPPISSSSSGSLGRFFRALGAFFLAIGSAPLAAVLGTSRGIMRNWKEMAYWFRLFLYTSHRFLRIEVYLAFVGAFIFFGWVLTQYRVSNMHDLLYFCYLYFTVVMVSLCMNLLPRERDEETLEILWSQPMRRGPLIILQLITMTVWLFLLSTVVVVGFSYFSAYTEGRWMMLLFLFTTSFTVGSITVLISTFCRHSIATGLVSLLILGVHFFWLRPLGPIELFYNPIPFPGMQGSPLFLGSLIFNRVIVLIVAGFVLDYLFRRLRHTAEWFT